MLTIHPVDEAIWHFVGLFEISEERGRMWVDYDRFAALKAEVDPGGITPLDLATKAPLDLGDLLPQIRYAPPDMPVPVIANEAPYFPLEPILQEMPAGSDDGVHGPDPLTQLAGAPRELHIPEPPDTPGSPEGPQWTLPAPEPVAVIVVQWNRLDDDDHVNVDQFTGGIVSSEALAQKLDSLLAAAERLGVGPHPDYPENDASYLKIAKSFKKSAASEPPDDEDGDATSTTLEGDAILGQYLDGVAVDQRPDVDDYLPEYRQDDDADDEPAPPAGDPNDAQSASGNSAGPDDPVSDDDGPAHELVHGNNTLVNEASISSAWIAAPIIVAAGDAYSYTIVSQTNVWSDADSVVGQAVAAGAAADDPTTSLNYASYVSLSNPVALRDGDGDAPQYWMTATLEGSLVSVNWVEQYNLVSDNDVTAVTIMGKETLYLMGENGAFNEVSISELGSYYDVIIVDGHVINLNGVMQTNVMLDDDRIMVSGGDARISAGDNLLVNQATIKQTGQDSIRDTSADQDAMLADAANGDVVLSQSILNDPALRDLEVVRVLHVKGDLVSLNIIRQTNVLGDSDQIEVYMDGMEDRGGEVSVVAGSNVLINSATIDEFGVDSTIYTGGHTYSDALLHQAELIATDAPMMAQGGGGLASEAVLFLADGMLGDEIDDIEFRPIGADHAPSADAMETVLA
ncbi:MAG: hypothetical protein ACK5IP_16525 [Paracoccus sp. (in: a-proteobacteria)]